METPAPMADDPTTAAVVVHASLRGVLASIASPLILVVIGGAALASGGVAPVPVIFVVAGVALALVVVLDLPRRAVFDATGITRVCPLRRQHLAWDEVVALERSRPSTASAVRGALDRREGREAAVSGGLVVRGRRKLRWLLTDRVESQAEHDRVVVLVRALDVPVAVRATRPHATAPPTDLYRRRRDRTT